VQRSPGLQSGRGKMVDSSPLLMPTSAKQVRDGVFALVVASSFCLDMISACGVKPCLQQQATPSSNPARTALQVARTQRRLYTLILKSLYMQAFLQVVLCSVVLLTTTAAPPAFVSQSARTHHPHSKSLHPLNVAKALLTLTALSVTCYCCAAAA
jgi:hypothetical protein